MQEYHVNLSSTTNGHAGTSADPMSWADVRTLLRTMLAYKFDLGTNFDNDRVFDGFTIDVVFRCRGTGLILNAENAVSLEEVDFLSNNGGIRFVADDPGQYGLPVIGTPEFGAGSTPIAPGASWFRASNCNGIHVGFTGFVFDVNMPFGYEGYNLIEISGGSSVIANMSKNIFIEKGVGHRFLYVHGSNSTARSIVAGNTVHFGTTSSGTHEFARVESGRLFAGLNYAAQAPTAQSIIVFATASGQLYTHANVFGLRGSALTYNGVEPTRYSADVMGIAPLTQGTFNTDAIDPTHAAPALSNGLMYHEASGFWPVHGGHLLKAGSMQIPESLDLGMTETDAFGYQRAISAQDCGAVQKSARTDTVTLHVDLGQTTTGGSGIERDPLGLAEFINDYSRRAPVDYSLNYIVRGRNSSPLPSLDLGPISPNPSAVDATYHGTGKIKISGYRTHNRNLPILSAQRIVPNAKMPVVIEKIKLEFTGGTDFIVGDIPADGDFRFRACVLRSQPSATGLFVRANTGTSKVHLLGCTVVQGHSNGSGSGLFYHAETGHSVHMCAINLLNQTACGTGKADVRACSISTGGAGNATWTGATVDVYTKLNASNAMVDPYVADFDAADFQLTADSAAIGILPDVGSIYADIEDLAYDCRNLRRSAFPTGSKSGDAGAYEFDYYVPEPEHRYMDIGKVRSGAGTQTDRWSPADMQAWADSLRLQNTLLNKNVVIHTSRSGIFDLTLRGIDADPNGALTFVAEGPAPLWEAERANMTIVDSTGVTLYTRGIMLRNSSGAEIAYARNCVHVDADFVNSIFDHKRETTAYHIHIGSQPQLSDIVTVTSITTTTFRPGIDFQIGETIEETAVALAAALNTTGTMTAWATSDTVTVTVPLSGAVTVTGTAYTIDLADAIVKMDSVVVRGCSFNDQNSGESGVVGVGIRAATAHVAYSAFQGHEFSATTRSGYAVLASEGTSFHNCTNEFDDVISAGVSDTGSIKSSSRMFQVLRPADTTIDAFKLYSTDCLDILDVTNLPAVFKGVDYQIDIMSHFRSRAYVEAGKNTFDAGACESTFLDASMVFKGTVSSPIIEVTPAGYALNSRALAGNVHYSLVGYAMARGGYVYWDPTQAQPALDPGSQAKASFRVANNNLAGDTVTVQGQLGSVTVAAGVDFEAGLTPASTAAAIAKALRANAVFNRGFWCQVDEANVSVYSWRFGSASAGCVLTVNGSALVVTQAFVAGQNLLGVDDQVYPNTGYAPWFGLDEPDPRSLGFVVRIEDGEFVYGELAVIARVHSSVFADEVGKTYVYARVRMPISVKHARRTLVQRVLIAY